MHNSTRPRDAVRQIVERTDLDRFTERILDSFWDRPEYRRFRPPREDVRAWVRWNIDLVVRWLVDDRRPSEADLARFRDRARDLAAEGMPADVVPANFRHGARSAWAALLEAARDDERLALLDSADLLFEFVDRVSQVFSDTYETAGPPLSASEEESAARTLLERLCSAKPLAAEDHRLGDRLGFDLNGAHRPFALAAAPLAVREHAELAEALRVRGVLATAEGRRVVGLAGTRTDWKELPIAPEATYARAGAVPRGELAESLDELRAVVELAARRGRTGKVDVDDHLAELLLQRAPGIAARLRERVYGRLAASDPELVRTLDVLVAHDFDRGAAAAALPVHRNTLGNRIKRIRAITGLDVGAAAGGGLLWLAWLERSAAEPSV